MNAFDGWDVAGLRASWTAAKPFSHVILDDFVPADTLASLSQAVAAEPHWPNRGEIFDYLGSADDFTHPVLQAFRARFAAPDALAAIQGVTGRAVTRVDMRSYVYMTGSYLLPHSDCRAGMDRQVAFAFYVWTHGCQGGELELFECEMDGNEVRRSRPATLIDPRANRIVLFEVSPPSLHQVREVLAGARVSLAGWFVS